MDDLQNLTQEKMFNHAVQLRNMDVGVSSMEEMAKHMVRYLYKSLVLPDGNPACALIRFFKTHPYNDLPPDLQKAAQQILQGRHICDDTKCLTLLATAGENPQWNSRDLSIGHKAIPLVDEDSVSRIPMISQLIWQFGLSIENVIQPNPDIILNLGKKTFNVFYIPQAIDSPYIPAQKNFVIPYQIKSVLGIGGMLLSGNIFTIILFSKVEIPFHLTHLFKWVAMYAKIATNSVEGDKNLFDNSPAALKEVYSQRIDTASQNQQIKNVQAVSEQTTDLVSTQLQNANLKGADLQNANLEGADLRGVNLQGANLEGANLKGAIMPDGTIYEG